MRAGLDRLGRLTVCSLFVEILAQHSVALHPSKHAVVHARGDLANLALLVDYFWRAEVD